MEKTYKDHSSRVARYLLITFFITITQNTHNRAEQLLLPYIPRKFLYGISDKYAA